MTRAAPGQGTVYKEPTSYGHRWVAQKWVRLLDGSHRRVKARGRTVAEAMERLERLQQRLRAHNPVSDRSSVRAFLHDWLEYKRPQVRPSSIAEYGRTLQKVMDMYGDEPLSKLTPRMIEHVMAIEANAGRYATANNVRRYLKQALLQAERWELLDRNPARHISPLKRPQVKRGLWDPPEIRAFLETAEGTTRYFALFHTAIFTGLRRGELMALPTANVSTTDVFVDRTFSRYQEGLVGPPKTRESTRRVPITPRVHEVIMDTAGEPLAFPSRSGEMVEEGNLGRAFTDTIKRADVPRIRFHDMRRIAATLWARGGAPPKVIQRLLGHSTPHLALAIYTDVMEGQLEDAALDPSIIGMESGAKSGA